MMDMLFYVYGVSSINLVCVISATNNVFVISDYYIPEGMCLLRFLPKEILLDSRPHSKTNNT